MLVRLRPLALAALPVVLVLAAGLLLARASHRAGQADRGGSLAFPPSTMTATPVAPSSPTPEPDATPALSLVAAAAARLAAAPTPQPPARVVAIEIPRLRVSAPVVALTVASDGTLGVPSDATTVGWYDFTAAPGTAGNAVFAGHVDWAGRAGTFARLADLRPGDTVTVRAGDAAMTYRVDRSYAVSVDDTNVAPIFAGDARQSITLITCGGTFDRSRREYLERTIVHAVRTDGS